MNTTTVIVSACRKKRDGVYLVYGDCKRETFLNLAAARSNGEAKKAMGLSVIVRPNYNEFDAEGKFFREWRSFDGAAFEEVRWRIGALVEASL